MNHNRRSSHCHGDPANVESGTQGYLREQMLYIVICAFTYEKIAFEPLSQRDPHGHVGSRGRCPFTVGVLKLAAQVSASALRDRVSHMDGQTFAPWAMVACFNWSCCQRVAPPACSEMTLPELRWSDAHGSQPEYFGRFRNLLKSADTARAGFDPPPS